MAVRHAHSALAVLSVLLAGALRRCTAAQACDRGAEGFHRLGGQAWRVSVTLLVEKRSVDAQ